MPLTERKLIERIARLTRAGSGRSRFLAEGIGDDCAILRLGGKEELLVTTDLYMEGIHFRRDWSPPESVGHCCLTRGLSDIAAMGGTPVAAFLSLALPADVPQPWVDGFLRGWAALARRFGVPLAGGDLGQSPAVNSNKGNILCDVMVLGTAPLGTAVRRSGARPGDAIYVTGALGAAAALIASYSRGGKPRANAPLMWPMPRVEAGGYLRRHGLATAMIDVSDGLSTDLDHICEASGLGAELEASSIPRAVLNQRPVDLDFALHGGEDYELLFTTAADVRVPSRIAGVPVTRIGRMRRGKGIVLIEDGRQQHLAPGGWEHFRPRTPVLAPAVPKHALGRKSR